MKRHTYNILVLLFVLLSFNCNAQLNILSKEVFEIEYDLIELYKLHNQKHLSIDSSLLDVTTGYALIPIDVYHYHLKTDSSGLIKEFNIDDIDSFVNNDFIKATCEYFKSFKYIINCLQEKTYTDFLFTVSFKENRAGLQITPFIDSDD